MASRRGRPPQGPGRRRRPPLPRCVVSASSEPMEIEHTEQALLLFAVFSPPCKVPVTTLHVTQSNADTLASVGSSYLPGAPPPPPARHRSGLA